MKLIGFQSLGEGDRLADAAIVFWRRDTVRDGQETMSAFGIALMLPIPIRGKYWDASLGALMCGWRLPRVSAWVRPERDGMQTVVFPAWMHPIGLQHLLAYRWQIEDGIYPPKQGAN